ncbi:MAG: DUF5103 domain-containing protein [Muribaculum sp.]|nr:DUF5103 domain-containing protein [Muribaculaceae bacterium]MCM1080977.1 DUF5103 domain-containing protein [Muribaculum sp.]
MRFNILHIILAFIGIISAKAEIAETHTQSFDANFRTIQVFPLGNDQLPPVITLNSDDRLLVSFDELAEEHSNLQYSLTHCNAQWQPENLAESEFLEGFNYADVVDFQYSRTTLAHYVNYRILIPNEQMQPLISGNYLLRVYRDNDPENTLLQVRFSVTEQLVKIFGNVSVSTDVDYRSRHQQLEFEVDGGDDLSIDDLSNRLIAVVKQNNRNDNSVTVTHPQFITSGKAHYKHLKPLIFPAGNEYRRFETVSTLYPGMNIAKIDFANGLYQMKVTTDTIRATEPYTYDRTQKGRFRIHEYNSTDADIDADYVVTHFELRLPGGMEAPMPLFIDGDMFNRNINDESIMRYDPFDKVYRKTVLLKQGAYNYQYLMPGLKSSATAAIEGDFCETENEYTIYIYYRQPGARYDRLIGVTTLFSANNKQL